MENYQTLLDRITPEAGGTREVLDPATGEIVGIAPVQGVSDLEDAIERATAAQPAWAARPDEDRTSILNLAADAIDSAAEALAELLSREQGKPLNGPNARFEVQACATWLRATAAIPLPKETVIDDGASYAELHYRPVGLVGVITPWNWPMMIAIWQIAPALRMGNAVIAKPSEYTTLSGLALIAVMNTVLPAGVLNVVTGAGDVGAALAAHPAFGKIMFTGSTATGRRIIQASAGNLARLTLELGGNDAGIVLPDVDARKIAPDLFWGAFINTGQTCAALKRLYVHADVYDAVCEALVDVAAAAPMGVGLVEANVLGPLQNRMQWNVVDSLVEAAKAGGGRVLLGGNPDRTAVGNFYPTTLIADLDPQNPLVIEEQFGPALPIVRYTDLDEVIDLANGLDVGLGASVWSADAAAARGIAARIQAGTVWINSHGGVHPMIPFGGVKGSGYGLEFGVEGLKSVSVPQVING
ncbi:aldehyde dehydrogenase family protein [Cryobacterium zhongshanensis]|uniref:Aldehyde dehydrogenase family protein n=1 Tax=Cryobacterium zhongshanensis TaxID=2928153 RepID=A0AA41QUH0_9MICO|nr:aldehyde dehydrogenase family protein [Cryobacterium zhongshanensis]MCI4657881.1 aldehyde dehydrogenase family protein [Cryobacterium zhongshanensis]